LRRLAARCGHAAALGALVASGADPNGLDGGGASVLQAAARGGHLAAVSQLLGDGAEVSEAALESAVEAGAEATAEVLSESLKAVTTAAAAAAKPNRLPAERTLHVRGIGADNTGEYETEGGLRRVFEQYGEVVQATVRHRIDAESGLNTSWALVTMGDVVSVMAASATAAQRVRRWVS
jgi:hypothetical protein